MIEFIQSFKRKILEIYNTDAFLNKVIKDFYFSPQVNAAYPYVMISDLSSEKSILNHGNQYLLRFKINIFAANDNNDLLYEILNSINNLPITDLLSEDYNIINYFAGRYIESPGHDLNTIKISIDYEVLVQD